MKNTSILLLLTMLSIGCFAQPHQPKTISSGYQIGDQAEDFKLKNVDGTMYSLADMDDAKGYIVVFTSNECPFAIAYEDRLIQLHNEMAAKGYPVVAINSNDGSEGGGNTVADMVTRYEDKDFPFVYLKDAKQDVFPKFGATKTPHVFLLDKDLIVKYIGAIDDNSQSAEDVEQRFVANAIEALENGKSPDPATTKAIGCPISSGTSQGGGRPDRKGPPSPDQILDMMDTNNDNQVSKAEVHGPLSRDFDRLDADKNGMLNKEELSKIRKPRRGK